MKDCQTHNLDDSKTILKHHHSLYIHRQYQAVIVGVIDEDKVHPKHDTVSHDVNIVKKTAKSGVMNSDDATVLETKTNRAVWKYQEQRLTPTDTKLPWRISSDISYFPFQILTLLKLCV